MLTDTSGNVLKSINDSQSGKNEEIFYKAVFSEEYFNEFCQFLPRFYGEKTVVADVKCIFCFIFLIHFTVFVYFFFLSVL